MAKLRDRIKELAKTKLNQADVVAKDAHCATPIHLPGLATACPAPREFVETVKKNKKTLQASRKNRQTQDSMPETNKVLKNLNTHELTEEEKMIMRAREIEAIERYKREL